jgi:hypothetical protein
MLLTKLQFFECTHWDIHKGNIHKGKYKRHEAQKKTGCGRRLRQQRGKEDINTWSLTPIHYRGEGGGKTREKRGVCM